jgi:hypothetical protein
MEFQAISLTVKFSADLAEVLHRRKQTCVKLNKGTVVPVHVLMSHRSGGIAPLNFNFNTRLGKWSALRPGIETPMPYIRTLWNPGLSRPLHLWHLVVQVTGRVFYLCPHLYPFVQEP